MCLPETADLRNEILDYISHSTEAYFKSQQIGDPELTVVEKRQIAETLLSKGPSLFLSRFGQYLSHAHLQYFKTSSEDQYTVDHYLQQCRTQCSTVNNAKLVRNRRFESLEQLIAEGSYFSESEMKSRNPLLYEHLVGQYLTQEEREEVDHIDTSNITFVNILLHQIDKDNEESFRKEQLEKEKIEFSSEEQTCSTGRPPVTNRSSRGDQYDKSFEVEYDSDEDITDRRSPVSSTVQQDIDNIPSHSSRTALWGEAMSDEPLSTPVGKERTPWATTSTAQKSNKVENTVPLTQKEKSILFEEFRTHMFTNFLDGKENEFDYSSVDKNPAYDNLNEATREAEEKYFDEDDEEEEMQVDEKEQVDNGREEEDSEDELDVFMNNLRPEILVQDINARMKSSSLKD